MVNFRMIDRGSKHLNCISSINSTRYIRDHEYDEEMHWEITDAYRENMRFVSKVTPTLRATGEIVWNNYNWMVWMAYFKSCCGRPWWETQFMRIEREMRLYRTRVVTKPYIYMANLRWIPSRSWYQFAYPEMIAVLVSTRACMYSTAGNQTQDLRLPGNILDLLNEFFSSF